LIAAALVSAAACNASTRNTATGAGGNAGSAGGDTAGAGGNGGDNVIGGGGNGGSTISMSCGKSTFANQVAGSILVVLDKSGSMAGGNGDPDKWDPTVAALKQMMAASSQELGMGLLPFPEGKFDDSGLAACALNPSSAMCTALFADGGCEDVAMMPVVPVGPLSMTQSKISAWLDANSPGGNTPTLTALKRAYGYMQAYDAPGERFVLLMTDGVPTTHEPAMGFGGFMIPESNIKCGELSDIEALALMAAQGTPKVKTFVIGSPGSEGAATFLSQLAINGETQKDANCSANAGDCHYQIGKANFAADLQKALDDIAGKLSNCVFAIPDGENADPDYVNVELDLGGMSTQLFKDTSHADGWDYTDSSHTKVELFGPSCDKFKASKGGQVSIILGCKTEVK
jgi:hypothetical protein